MILFRQILLWTILASISVADSWAGERTWYRPRLMQPATEAVPPTASSSTSEIFDSPTNTVRSWPGSASQPLCLWLVWCQPTQQL